MFKIKSLKKEKKDLSDTSFLQRRISHDLLIYNGELGEVVKRIFEVESMSDEYYERFIAGTLGRPATREAYLYCLYNDRLYLSRFIDCLNSYQYFV